MEKHQPTPLLPHTPIALKIYFFHGLCLYSLFSHKNKQLTPGMLVHVKITVVVKQFPAIGLLYVHFLRPTPNDSLDPSGQNESLPRVKMTLYQVKVNMTVHLVSK